jgi:heptosyltransferase-2
MKLSADKILVMRYRFIGDTVLTVPFLRNLRMAYPKARIDLMVEPFSGQVIAGCPYVDKVIPFELKTIHRYSAQTDRGRLSAYRHYRLQIRDERYDAAFVLKRSLSSALLVRAAGVPRRIGFATEWRSLLLSDPVPYRDDQHEVENFLDCLRALAIPVGNKDLELWPLPEHAKEAEGRFARAGWRQDDIRIVIHPAASLPAKQWPVDRFVEVMKQLKASYPVRFVYSGAKDDAHLYERIESLGPFGGLDLCGVTTLRENVALYSVCDLFFGVDSGPMHMAAAAGIPVVALFGPTDERKWGPWGRDHIVLSRRLACHPCKPHKCGKNDCMELIGVDEAFGAVEKQISRIMERGTRRRA